MMNRLARYLVCIGVWLVAAGVAAAQPPTLPPGVGRPPSTMDDEGVVNSSSRQLNLEPADRQQLLERHGPRARAEALVGLLDRR